VYIFATTFIFIFSGVICHYLAKLRGAKPVFWGVMGVVFGPLAIPFVFMARKSEHNHYD